MKIKKTFALLSALCIMGAMTGCDNSESSSEVTTTTTTSTTKATTTTTTTATTEPPQDFTPDKNAITFDTASLYTLHCMGGKNFEDDEAECKLSIVDVDGDKKVLVEVIGYNEEKGEYKIPKLVFNIAELIGVENTGKIGHISVDFTCVAKDVWKNADGTESLVVGNFLGALAGNIAAEKGTDAEGNLIQNAWANHVEFALDDWENAEHSWRVETDVPKLLAMNGYADNYAEATLVIMRWAQKNQVDFYIDNVTFYDKDGNSMPIIYDAEANLAADNNTDGGADATTPAE